MSLNPVSGPAPIQFKAANSASAPAPKVVPPKAEAAAPVKPADTGHKVDVRA